MERLYKKYYFDSGKFNLIELVDCFENILYHTLLDYDVDYKFYFCEDINLVINTDKNVSFNTNNLRLNDNLFNINMYELEPNEAFKLIEKHIDQQIVVAFCTMFDMLPPYDWYKREDKIGKSNTHYSMIVGYDNENYYVVDAPSMLNEERTIRYSKNTTVFCLNKKVLYEAFKKYCKIVAVTVNTDMLNISYQEIFEAVKLNIIKNYLSKDKNLGRNALIKLSIEVKNNSAILLITKDYFWIYLMRARRIILKQCLLDLKKEYNYSDKIIQCLDKDIMYWKLLYVVIAKHENKPNNNINQAFINLLESIIKIEDELVCLIETMSFLNK